MSLEAFHPAPLPPNERNRERAVEASGALSAYNDPVLQQIVEDAQVSSCTSMAAISILHSDWQYLIAASGIKPGVYSRRTSLCGHTIASGKPIFLLLDAKADERFAGNPVVGRDRLVRFYAAVPLLSEDALPLGTLCVFDPSPRRVIEGSLQDKLVRLGSVAMSRLRDLNEVAQASR